MACGVRNPDNPDHFASDSAHWKEALNFVDVGGFEAVMQRVCAWNRDTKGR